MEYPYVYWMVSGSNATGRLFENVSILVALHIDQNGNREIIDVAESMKEDTNSWLTFLKSLEKRGLSAGDKCLELVEALATVFSQVKYQQWIVHFYRNVFSVVPKSKGKHVAQMLKAIHAQEDKQSAQ